MKDSNLLKRLFDILFATLLIVLLLPAMLLVAFLIKTTSRGPIIFWSKRVGRNNKIFMMPKFRTMKLGTPIVATDQLGNSSLHLIWMGSFLRKTSIDELPQMFSVLFGFMSFVGPRPALYNQYELIELRSLKGIHKLYPGITGWAQINGRDDLSTIEKIRFDEEYQIRKSLLFDFKIIISTLFRVLKAEGVRH